MDLFENLRCQMGVQNISDLKQADNLRQSLKLLTETDLNQTTLKELSDAANYFCGEKKAFTSVLQAAAYFRDYYRKLTQG